ncbi:hypothetical protein GCM10023189_00920 [Nibrella saemangeumensis]|uniref:Helix-turn-helix domain-containing protein n=1 Tax=Nibrella saemangeumensis TaxID=1084526 RepID=A0ABP8MAZ4_9BACT
MFQHTIQVSITPDQLVELVRSAIRDELAAYIPPRPEGPDLPEFLTRKQTAKLLSVSLPTLHEWAKDTEERSAILIPQKINGRVLYRRADVLAAMKEVRRLKKSN